MRRDSVELRESRVIPATPSFAIDSSTILFRLSMNSIRHKVRLEVKSCDRL